jgi:hypothetical protein
MVSDPNFRKENPQYFPVDLVDNRIEWQRERAGYDLYDPQSAAYQLGISVSLVKDFIRNDSPALC